MRPGELSVMMLGMIWMPMWPAQVSATPGIVCYHLYPIKNEIMRSYL